MIPRDWKILLRGLKILVEGQGYMTSIKTGSCLDAKEEEIPWYTYPAIEYIRQLDFTSKTCFEFGSGNSSIFWSRLCEQVVSVEDNPEWFHRVKGTASENQKILLREKKEDYFGEILKQDQEFDVIVVDGNHRLDCTKNALKCLKSGGLVVLDNSDWFLKSAETLREAGLLQVDFHGFGPINSYCWTTSLFFHREFQVKPKEKRMPSMPIGGIIETPEGEQV